MQRDITPEEKLLKLIKEGSPQKSSDAKPNDAGKEPDSLLIKTVSRPKPYPFKWIKGLSFINVGLILFLFLLLGYQFLIGEPVLPLPIRETSGAQFPQFSSVDLKPTENPDDYLKILSERNFFKSIGESPPVLSPNERTLGFSDLVKNLHLSGIILGDTPQAVIEDRSNGQVYYVESGDYVGPLQVIEVGNDHVLLRHGDEEGQLNL